MSLPWPPSWRRKPAWVAGLVLIPILIPGIHGLFDIALEKKEPSLHLLDRSFQFIATLENKEGGFGYWEMPETLPPLMVMAALAAEDRRFYGHPGVDFRAVGSAMIGNYIHHRGYRGASTLAMQVARLQHGGKSGWYYKIHDAVAATGITLFYGRDKVLRQYFRLAPYGNRISGAACASRRYFRKPVQDLSLAEAALLAALPKAPSRFNLFRAKGFSLAKRRANLILKRAAEYGWISAETHRESAAELESLLLPSLEYRRENSYHFLRQCSLKLGRFPHASGEIRTTLDLRIQDTLLANLRREIPRLEKHEAKNAAGMVLDVKTGEVLGYIGSLDYWGKQGGAIDCAALPRSTGSLLKPFIYGLGMEWNGFTAGTILTDLGFDFGSGRHSFVPENYDHKFQGPVLYKNALANSRNIPAMEVLRAVGVDIFYRQCIALGLATDDGQAGYYGLGLSIGGLYCSLQQICAAYLTLANQGRKRDLVWEMKEQPGGKDVVSAQRILPPDIAMQLKRFLSDPIARLPSFPRGGNLEYPYAVAVKTGTSEAYRDSWCVAFSDRYLVAVWIGNTDFTTTKMLSGYEGPARIVKRMMYALEPDRTDGLSDIEFPPPPGYVAVPICRLTGKRADQFTPFMTTEYFRPGTDPLEFSSVHRLLPVDKRNGLLAYPPCPVPIEYRRFTVLAPQYRDWAVSQGLEVPPDRYSPACGGAPTVDEYAIAITSPRTGSRFYIDPEMPPDKSLLPINVRVFPPSATLLWLMNGQEYRVVKYPFTLMWPMQPGNFVFQAVVPGTQFRSQSIKIEVY